MNLSSKPSSFVVFSGGSACNHILNAFHETSANDVSYILGISDNGGSTVSSNELNIKKIFSFLC